MVELVENVEAVELYLFISILLFGDGDGCNPGAALGEGGRGAVTSEGDARFPFTTWTP